MFEKSEVRKIEVFLVKEWKKHCIYICQLYFVLNLDKYVTVDKCATAVIMKGEVVRHLTH